MREYEELLVATENSEGGRSGVLDTIEEDRDLEEKVPVWEEEITGLHEILRETEERHREELEAIVNRQEEEDAMRSEMQRLEQVRSSIQEECHQLQLRKDQLRQEVGQLTGQRKEESSPVLASGALSLDGPYASVTAAYSIILEDIWREKAEIEAEVQSYPAEVVRQRLEQQVKRCKQLQSALALQRAEAARSMEERREQHQEEVDQLEALVTTSQSLVVRQNRKFLQQMDKMLEAETVMARLLEDNNMLTTQLRSVKHKLKVNKLQTQVVGARSKL